MSANTPATVVAAQLAAKNGVTPPASTEGVTTPAKAPKAAKAQKAPKASPPSVVGKKGAASSLISYEPGIVTLKLSEIDTSPDANTTRPEWAERQSNAKALQLSLRELAESIKTSGQQTPVVVQRVKGGTKPYRLAAGYRRCAAMELAGLDSIEARIEVSGTDEARVLVNIVENENAKEETTALGKLKAVESLMAFGYNAKEVAARMGNAEDFVRDLMRIPGCSPELRAAIMAPEGSDEHIDWSVGRLLTRKPVDQQPKLLKHCRDLTVEATRAYLAELNSGSKKNSGSDGDDDDSDNDGKGGKEHDDVYPEGRVVKATIPFIVRLSEAQELMNAAFAQLEKAIEATGLKIPPMNDAMKALEQAQSAYGKTGNMMVTAVSNLLGEKGYTTHLKAALKAAKE